MKENQREEATCRQIFARAVKEYDGRFAEQLERERESFSDYEQSERALRDFFS